MKGYKFVKSDFKNNKILYLFIVIELVIAISYISKFFLTIEYKERANNIIEKSIGNNDTYSIGLHPEIISNPSSDEMKAFSSTLEYLYDELSS